MAARGVEPAGPVVLRRASRVRARRSLVRDLLAARDQVPDLDPPTAVCRAIRDTELTDDEVDGLLQCPRVAMLLVAACWAADETDGD